MKLISQLFIQDLRTRLRKQFPSQSSDLKHRDPFRQALSQIKKQKTKIDLLEQICQMSGWQQGDLKRLCDELDQGIEVLSKRFQLPVNEDGLGRRQEAATLFTIQQDEVERCLEHLAESRAKLREMRALVRSEPGFAPLRVRQLIFRSSLVAFASLTLLLVHGYYKTLCRWQAQFYDDRELTSEPRDAETYRMVDFSWKSGPTWKVPRENFAMVIATCWNSKKAGEYSFKLASDDGSRLFLNGTQVINQWQLQSLKSKEVKVSISEGVQKILVHYFQGRGDMHLDLKITDPDGKGIDIGAENSKLPLSLEPMSMNCSG